MTKFPEITAEEIAALKPYINDCFKEPVTLEDGFIYLNRRLADRYPVGHYGIANVTNYRNKVFASDVTGDADELIVALDRLNPKDRMF